MKHALVNLQNEILRLQDFEDAAPQLAEAKGLRWLPVVYYWLDGYGIGIAIPEGAIEVPERTSPDHVWQNSSWVYVKPVPSVISMRQARIALFGAGLLDSVNAAIEALESPQKEVAKIEWEYSQEVHRHRELVAVLGPQLGLSAAQIDELFITAHTL